MFLENMKDLFGDWGLGIGDWGLGFGPNPQAPIHNPHEEKLLDNNCPKNFGFLI